MDQLSPREGEHSRQAHCDSPADTDEREMGGEGFFGAVTHLHHKHPPTGWIDWQDPLRPHAFNFNRIPSEPCIWRKSSVPAILPADSTARAQIRALALHLACDVRPFNNLRVLQYLNRELGVDDAAKSAWYRHWGARAWRRWSGGWRRMAIHAPLARGPAIWKPVWFHRCTMRAVSTVTSMRIHASSR